MNAAHHAYEKPLEHEERDRLLMEQLPQVKYIARRIHERLPQHVPLDDLVQAGVLGLMDALQKYDDRKNVQFKSYAKFRIRGAILDSLRELDWSPRDLRRKARSLEQANSKLGTELGRTATEHELAVELGMGLTEFQHLLTELGGLDVGSLQIESSDGGRDEDLCEFLPGDPEDNPFIQCLNSEMKEMLAKAIGRLPEKDQQVLSLYYTDELTMKEVGAVLGVGESRVSQIHSLALIRLRSSMQEMMAIQAGPARLAAEASIMEATWKRY